MAQTLNQHRRFTTILPLFYIVSIISSVGNDSVGQYVCLKGFAVYNVHCPVNIKQEKITIFAFVPYVVFSL